MTSLTCLYDENNKLLVKHTQILKFYLKSWLLADIISILPYENLFEKNSKNEFSNQDYFQLFKLLRILKYFLYKIPYNNIVTEGDNLKNSKNFLSLDVQYRALLNIVLNTLILLHVFTCLFYLAARFEKFSKFSWVNFIPNDDLLTIYITSFYWATQTVTVVGYGDIFTKVSIEINLVVIWLLIGVGFYSFTIGNLRTILSSYDTNIECDQDLFLVDQLSSTIKMPNQVATDLLNYVMYNIVKNPFWSASGKKIINTLPPNLRNFTILTVSWHILSQVAFFQHDVNFTAEILPSTMLQTVRQGETIYRQGQPSNEIYYLLKGQVQVTLEDETPLITIAEGQVFGEIESIEQKSRQYFCTAVKQSVILIYPATVFLKKVQKDQYLFFEFNELYQRRRYLINSKVNAIQILREQIQSRHSQQSVNGQTFDLKSSIKMNSKYDQIVLTFRKQIIHPTRKSTLYKDIESSKLIQFLVGHKQKRKQEIRIKFQNVLKF